jgi:hypothetical protein
MMTHVRLEREDREELQNEKAERRLQSEEGDWLAGSQEELFAGESRSELTVTVIVVEARGIAAFMTMGRE